MNDLQERELETFEQDDRFKVTDLDSANWVFKKLDAITTKENEINDLANKEIERINEWKDKEVEKLQSGKEYLQSLVIEYYVTENGTLIDANGEVLEGASIVEKPTSYTVKVGE
ncbi:host-nuclease inhibitor Gam family protein [Staphylococcus aureus]|uniref:host-nuclease inhibitor Gam family protein n=1 Tax=Staphylococcus aureus TaxID=1280 RepID=UPI000DB17D25|nr:host-nuclease inhibitor Gam family protein [Staphylococcus aureus]MBW7465323.1 host-nuclease inhibitor Gam family protein [Staphylococcus aureus]